MKKIVLVCGLIAGLIMATVMVVSTMLYHKNGRFEGSMLIGYASMILAFSLIFIAIKNYRDQYNNGIISFGKAFKIGLYITLVASTIYVLVWLIEYYFFIPDFMDRYGAYVMRQAAAAGATQQELSDKVNEMARYKQLYQNPLMVILLTFMEVLPVGIIVSLICSLILKRKHAQTTGMAAG